MCVNIYEVQSIIIFLGSSVLDVLGNSRALKVNKAQTKLENITGVQCNSWVSTDSGFNFVLSFFTNLYL